MSTNLSKIDLQTVFEDLMSRFIINVPEQELRSTERICFQIEQAHWYYEDFLYDNAPNQLPHFTLKKFAAEMFSRCPLLHEFLTDSSIEAIYEKFITYKMNVPVCGAIILNQDMDKVLLVRGFSARSGWSFPRGKINQNESEMNCAIRETKEETGFDISSLTKEDRFIECMIRGEQKSRFYIITGVSEQTAFEPKTRKEIGEIRWHKLKELPGFSKKGRSPSAGSDKFFMINRITKELWRWMNVNKKNLLQEKLQSHSINLLNMIKSTGDSGVMLGTSPTMSIGNESSTNDSSEEDEHTSNLKSMLGLSDSVSKQGSTSSLDVSDKANGGLVHINGVQRSKTDSSFYDQRRSGGFGVSLLQPAPSPQEKRKSNTAEKLSALVSPLLLLSPSKKGVNTRGIIVPESRATISSPSLQKPDTKALLSILKDSKSSRSSAGPLAGVVDQNSITTEESSHGPRNVLLSELNMHNSPAIVTPPSSNTAHASSSPITIPSSSYHNKHNSGKKDLLRILKGEV